MCVRDVKGWDSGLKVSLVVSGLLPAKELLCYEMCPLALAFKLIRTSS